MQINLKSSTIQFIRQRVTAVMLIPLLLWLVVYLINLCRVAYLEDIMRYLAHPASFSLIIAFIFISIYHAYLGVEDIMKDYIHWKTLYRFLHILLAIICISTIIISIINMFFYHLLFRYITGMVLNGT